MVQPSNRRASHTCRTRALERGPESHPVPLRADVGCLSLNWEGARVFVDEFKATPQGQCGNKQKGKRRLILRGAIAQPKKGRRFLGRPGGWSSLWSFTVGLYETWWTGTTRSGVENPDAAGKCGQWSYTLMREVIQSLSILRWHPVTLEYGPSLAPPFSLLHEVTH